MSGLFSEYNALMVHLYSYASAMAEYLWQQPAPTTLAVESYTDRATESIKEHGSQGQLDSFTSPTEIPVFDMPAPFDNEQAGYQRALHFITENEPEGRLEVHLSHESFIALQEQNRELYATYCYCCGLTNRIKTQPSPLVTGIGAFVQQSIIDSARATLIQQNRPDLAARIVPAGEFGIGHVLVDDELGESTLPTDGGLQEDNDNVTH
ncbi:hypothetical protein V1524DRAFT_410839 [Lipomyces starkeyi]